MILPARWRERVEHWLARPLGALAQLGLSGRILAILALVLVLDLGANALLLERSNDFELEAQEAAPLARQLIEARGALSNLPARERTAYTAELSRGRLRFSWSPEDRKPVSGIQLARLQEQLLGYQSELSHARMQILVAPLPLTDGLSGSLILADGTGLRFSYATHAVWPLVLGHLVNFLAPTTAFALLAWLLTYASLRPLRKLVRATARVGTRHASPIEMAGPVEVQRLISAFNSMQERIDALLDASRETMLAIAHDLRTPLARMQLRHDALDMADEDREALETDLGEIRDLLASLQNYVDLDSSQAPREQIDLAAMAQTLVDQACERGAVAHYHGPDHLVISARPLALRRALSNLVENALHYGGNARLALSASRLGVAITVEDDGPGIPPEDLEKALQPFVRLDRARERNTGGMGLGLAIVARAVESEGGTLTLANRPGGGLKALIRLPAQRG